MVMEEELYVDSTLATRIKYYFDQSILEIKFKSNGQVWHYFDFPNHFGTNLKLQSQ